MVSTVCIDMSLYVNFIAQHSLDLLNQSESDDRYWNMHCVTYMLLGSPIQLAPISQYVNFHTILFMILNNKSYKML